MKQFTIIMLVVLIILNIILKLPKKQYIATNQTNEYILPDTGILRNTYGWTPGLF